MLASGDCRDEYVSSNYPATISRYRQEVKVTIKKKYLTTAAEPTAMTILNMVSRVVRIMTAFQPVGMKMAQEVRSGRTKNRRIGWTAKGLRTPG